jgi:hypothetical protein
MMRFAALLIFTLLWLQPGPVTAAPAGAEEDPESTMPRGALYRYHTEEDGLVITSTLTPEAIQAGYEILDRQGNVVKKVEPPPSEKDIEAREEARKRRQQEEKQKREDERLLRLYAGPDDAIRARDRQLEALRLNISYARNNIEQVEQKLNEEVSAAARHERRGREVPETIRKAIDRYQRQLQELNEEVDQYQADMEEVRLEFKPIIKRLRVLTGDQPPPETTGGDTTSVPPENQSAQ